MHFEGIHRLEPELGRYFANCHKDDEVINTRREILLKDSKLRIEYDGLSNLCYKLYKIVKTKLYTKIIVSY